MYESDYVAPEVVLGTADDLTIRKEGDVWLLQGDWLDRLVSRVNFADYESRMYTTAWRPWAYKMATPSPSRSWNLNIIPE